MKVKKITIDFLANELDAADVYNWDFFDDLEVEDITAENCNYYHALVCLEKLLDDYDSKQNCYVIPLIKLVESIVSDVKNDRYNLMKKKK